MLPDVKDRQQLIALHKSAKKAGLNLHEYNNLKREIAEIENDIRRLRDPLCLHLPATPAKASNYSETEITTAKKLKQFISDATGMTTNSSASAPVPGSFTDRLQRNEILKISSLLQKLRTKRK